MPNYEVHKKIGSITALIISITLIILFKGYFEDVKLKILIIPFIAIFYSNLPDLDHHMGRLRKKTLKFIFTVMILASIISFFINIGLLLVLLSIVGILGLQLLKIPHRGPLHTYWFVFFVFL